jgi:hypothetical protein
MTVFWDVAPCGLVEVNRRFRGGYCLHHQGNLMIEAASSVLANLTILSDMYEPGSVLRNILIAHSLHPFLHHDCLLLRIIEGCRTLDLQEARYVYLECCEHKLACVCLGRDKKRQDRSVNTVR